MSARVQPEPEPLERPPGVTAPPPGAGLWARAGRAIGLDSSDLSSAKKRKAKAAASFKEFKSMSQVSSEASVKAGSDSAPQFRRVLSQDPELRQPRSFVEFYKVITGGRRDASAFIDSRVRMRAIQSPPETSFAKNRRSRVVLLLRCRLCWHWSYRAAVAKPSACVAANLRCAFSVHMLRADSVLDAPCLSGRPARLLRDDEAATHASEEKQPDASGPLVSEAAILGHVHAPAARVHDDRDTVRGVHDVGAHDCQRALRRQLVRQHLIRP